MDEVNNFVRAVKEEGGTFTINVIQINFSHTLLVSYERCVFLGSRIIYQQQCGQWYLNFK